MTHPEQSQDTVVSLESTSPEADSRTCGPESGAEPEPAREHTFESSLILNCLEGDQGSIEILYRKSVDLLLILARTSEKKNLRRWGVSAFESLIHDIVTETIGKNLSGLRRIAYFDDPGAGYHARLRNVFQSRVIDRHRRWTAKEGKHLSLDLEAGDRSFIPVVIDPGAGPADAAATAEFAEMLGGLMEKALTSDERELILNETIGEASRAERAIRLGITEKALAVKLFRIRQKLKAALRDACQHSDYF